MIAINAFVTYETAQFPCGGISPVLSKLPGAMRQMSDSRVIVVAPRHMSSDGNNKILSQTLILVGRGQFRYRGDTLGCSAWRMDGAVPTYFVAPDALPDDEPPAFAGVRHPYDMDSPTLLRDSMVFGAIVAELLPFIGADVVGPSQTVGAVESPVDWRLLMQDWEAATTALVVAEREMTASLFLVLHNSYDCYAPDTDDVRAGAVWPGLNRIGIDGSHGTGRTIIQRVLPLVRTPVFTVSTQFASEFTEDLLQSEVMAPHLQELLSRLPIVGVDNGPFAALGVPVDLTRRAAVGEPESLLQWKATNRAKALDALAAHVSTADRPLWGDRAQFEKGCGPWFVMAGRDDPRQKGYDVAAVAVEAYLARHQGEERCPQFVFFPIPGEEGTSGLHFLRELASRRPASVLVLPFRWAEGFLATLQASSFGLMPSIYEPFGMGNEFYLLGGCVGIARATGGNVEQIVPLLAARSCSESVRRRAGRFHAMSSLPTGLLFREPDDAALAVDWRALNAAGYRVGSSDCGRVQERLRIPLFESMAAELLWALEDGMHIVDTDPALYGRMVANGIDYISRSFSWARAAQEYSRHLDCPTRVWSGE